MKDATTKQMGFANDDIVDTNSKMTPGEKHQPAATPLGEIPRQVFPVAPVLSLL